jgi:hypothetical protein
MRLWTALCIVTGFIGRLLLFIGSVVMVYGYWEGYENHIEYAKVTLLLYAVGTALRGI